MLGSAERGYIISGSVAGRPLDGDTFGGFIFRETWIVGTQGVYVRSSFISLVFPRPVANHCSWLIIIL